MKIKHIHLDKQSLRGRFNRFLLFIFIIISLVFVTSNLVGYFSLQKYSHTVKQYSELSLFYNNTESLNQSVINYIFSNDTAEIDSYNRFRLKALENLEYLKKDSGKEWIFRLNLLANMTETYSERVNNMLVKGKNYDPQVEYDSLEHLKELIIDTYSNYSQLLTREVEKEQNDVIKLWHWQIIITIILFSLLLLISIIFSVLSVRSITHPINEIIQNINRIKEGEFHIETVEVNNREIFILLKSFEEMAEKIHNYVEQLKEKSKIEKQLIETENENLKIMKTLTESRLIALQEQMNPHFLFNTLSMISKQAYIEGAQITSELMIRTANLLRYSMEMSSKVSNLALELECIKNYFDIQKRRMGNRVAFTINADDQYDNVEIPGMILQPLIENCILHGINDLIKDAIVTLEVRRIDERIQITIEDNGSGIEPECLERLNNRDNQNNKNRIGLLNLRKRLDLCFGSDYLFNIESEAHCGTVVTINIPEKVKTGQG